MTWRALALAVLLSLGAAAGEPPAKKCAKIPTVSGEAFAYGKQSLSVPTAKWTVQTEQLEALDVDGRGSPLFRVPHLEWLGPMKDVRELQWDLYLVENGCARLVGLVHGHAAPVLLEQSSHGLRDFSVMSTDADGELRLTKYRYDGARYQGGRAEPR